MTEKKESRELVPVGMTNGQLTPTTLQEAVEMAKLIAHSGMVPKQYDGNPGAVLVAAQMGAELGLSWMASVQNIAVINGRPSLWGDAVLAVCRRHPDFEYCKESLNKDKTVATCIVKRRNEDPVERSFSVDEAKKAGLLGKSGPWTQYTTRMLQMRARGFALRDVFPDALRGIHVAEEVQDYDAGEVRELPSGAIKLRELNAKPAQQADTPKEQEVAPAEVQQDLGW